MTRTQPTADVLFLVTIEQRPELRKMFAPAPVKPRIETPGTARRPMDAERQPTSASRVQPPGAPEATARSTTSASAELNQSSEGFAVQVIALNDPTRARAILGEMKAAGLPAYLLEPPASEPDAPYRVRLGRYTSRADAEAAALQVGKTRGEKLWVDQRASRRKLTGME